MVEPEVTVVIPTYNRASMLRELLERMVAQETGGLFTFEVLVIDDASDDATPSVVEEIAERADVPVRYVRERGVGYTGVLNRAVKEFRGAWFAVFDDDQMTHVHWLRQLLEAGRRSGADMVGGPIQLDLPADILNRLGPVCRDLLGESPDVREPEKYRQNPPYPSGGNRLVRRRVFETIGGFDETMLTGGCDRDFLLRALAAGMTTCWVEEAVGMHRIPHDRLSAAHVRWYSLQWGCSFAHIDRKRWGMGRTACSAAARVGQAVLINLPVFLLARLSGRTSLEQDRRALLWRAVGYVRKTLRMLAPGLFPQEKFFARVEFRRSREAG